MTRPLGPDDFAAHFLQSINVNPTTPEIGGDGGVHLIDRTGTYPEIEDPFPLLVPGSPFRDDLAADMQDMTRAQVGPGGHLLDDFDQLWKLKQQQRDALKEQAQFNRTNPPSILEGVLGQTVTVTTKPSSNGDVGASALVQAAYWAGDDSETTPMIVTLGQPVQLITTAAAGAIPSRPFALVKFGTRAAPQFVEVDVCQGVQFPISGSMVSVEMGIDASHVGGLQDGSVLSAKLSGMVSFRNISKAQPLTRTRYITINGGMGGVDNFVTVPPMARAFAIWRNPVTDGPYDVQLIDSSGVIRYDFVLGASSPMLTPIPFGGDITTINISSTGFVAVADVIFFLGL